MKLRYWAALALPLAAPLQAQYAENTPIAGGKADLETSWKYFYFHKDGVSEVEAREDVIQCYGYASGLQVMKQGSNPTYMSIPYAGSGNLSPLAAGAAGAAGALIGGIIAGLMAGGERRAMERTNLRKCFGFKGYSRYELTKEEYEALMDGDGEVVRARLVEKITGAKPEAERLVP